MTSATTNPINFPPRLPGVVASFHDIAGLCDGGTRAGDELAVFHVGLLGQGQYLHVRLGWSACGWYGAASRPRHILDVHARLGIPHANLYIARVRLV